VIVAVTTSCAMRKSTTRNDQTPVQDRKPTVEITVTEAPERDIDKHARTRQYAKDVSDASETSDRQERLAEVVTRPRPTAEVLETRPPSTEPAPRYDRREWRHWIDADGDCQDTRQEVLIAESEVPVTFENKRRCRVRTGRWTCPYTGEVFTSPRRLDVDHFVPLANAARSGGGSWNEARKRAYANDLDDPDHLLAVSATANRSKGSKGPEGWLPSRLEFRCEYIRTWTNIKNRWRLTTSTQESAAIDRELRLCGGATMGKAINNSVAPKPATLPLRPCCRRCKKGCPCGDSCIPCSRACTKPAGCACNSSR